jgi:hypothetical protein
MEEQEQNQSVDPATLLSSPDTPAAAPEEPAMSVGQPATDIAADAKAKKIDDLCGAVTDPKLAPPDLMVKANEMAADSKWNPFGKIPIVGDAMKALQKGLAKGPMGYGFGDEGKQACVEDQNRTPGERVGKVWNDLKSYAKSKLPFGN